VPKPATKCRRRNLKGWPEQDHIWAGWGGLDLRGREGKAKEVPRKEGNLQAEWNPIRQKKNHVSMQLGDLGEQRHTPKAASIGVGRVVGKRIQSPVCFLGVRGIWVAAFKKEARVFVSNSHLG